MQSLIRSALLVSVAVGSLVGAKPALATSAAHYRQLGLQYRSQERFPDAIAALQKAVELDAKNINGRINLGWTLHLAKQEQAAIEMLESTIPYNPFHVPTFNALGIVYLVKGDLMAAILTHSWAAMLNSQNEIAYYNLSLGFERVMAYDWAISCAETAVELEPSNPHPLVALAIAQNGQGDLKQAQRSFQQAINLDGRYRDRRFLDFLAEAGFSADQIQESKRLLETLP